ncbi:MAG: hypothetical protein OXL34_01105 [Gemmatimonadota bacterium]|nr:hypothetical protein [Gemmatimonadota bacterium]
MRPLPPAATLVAVLAAVTPSPTHAQSGYAPDTFEDSVAHLLYAAARANWKSLDESVLRYSALIRQRSATKIRALFRDRTLYHNETAVRAFWERDRQPVVQVLGTRSEYPGRDIAIREGDLDFLEDLPFDRPFDPGSDRLLFGIPDQGNLSLEPEDDEYWLAHPLAEGADSLYRFRSGDTLTLSFADGRRLRAIQLDVLPREADAHRISGALWIEPESGALVRAVYRLSREFDAMRDVPDLEREEERGTFRFIPGLVKPWTFDLTMIAVDYSLWDFKAWLPHSMRVEGEAAAGIIKIPVSMDISYQIESVILAEDEEPDPAAGPDQPFVPPLKHVHFKTRAEAMAFIAKLLSEDEAVDYEALGADEPGLVNSSWMIAPRERHLVEESPHLPPPVWEDAIGFPSDAELERFVEKLADLPAPSVAQAAFGFHWGWARPDLIRYNRVEGPAFGGRLEWALGRRFSLGTAGFFGLADLRPKVRLDLQRSTMQRRLSLGTFHELRPTDPGGRYLDFGNSLNAFLFGRDNGEYYRATGADFTWRPPDGARESFTFRAYAERQSAVANEIDFALFRAFDGDGTFRPNMKADHVAEAGAELRLSPWWGNDPGGVQLGVDLHGRWAMWRVPGEDARTDYRQASLTLRSIIPVAGDGWRRWNLGFEAAAGTTWGDAPVQRSWFLGGGTSLRGYSASVVSGLSFARGRVEASRLFEAGSAILFGDAGWAGDRSRFDSDDILYGVGLGGSVLDGLIRLDFSHGLKGPHKGFRVDLYLDAIL